MQESQPWKKNRRSSTSASGEDQESLNLVETVLDAVKLAEDDVEEQVDSINNEQQGSAADKLTPS